MNPINFLITDLKTSLLICQTFLYSTNLILDISYIYPFVIFLMKHCSNFLIKLILKMMKNSKESSKLSFSLIRHCLEYNYSQNYKWNIWICFKISHLTRCNTNGLLLTSNTDVDYGLIYKYYCLRKSKVISQKQRGICTKYSSFFLKLLYVHH